MSKKSSILKLLSDVSEDRIIKTFPSPFKINLTPYFKLDFSATTRSVCAKENKLPTANLKICKVIILGDMSVGKTCIVNRFCRQIFDSNYKATIGVDFEVEHFDILSMPFNLQIWDTAGQERFKCIAQSYFRAAHVIVVAFDLTNSLSLTHSKIWLQEALSATACIEPLIFLVGTKKDLLSDTAYNSVEMQAARHAKKINAEYWAVSSKTGENIKELFFRIAALAFDAYIFREYEKNICKNEIASDLLWYERTDPQENVFEDIAIAAYLIYLWQNKNKGTSKPSFVDLGCGNGLLVYILTSEGYSGFGVDVRSRKIWELYPEFVKLEEKSIIPSSTSLFPQSDWIIGNHSDELTPWIPVIALRSSQKTNFFLLPCCAYDFDGKKYKRLNSSQSQYTEYLQYVKQMCIKCGFKTEIDKLRIPSTKRNV